ncbi:protein bicaudal D [Ischnura elegans]|uniref:protein bicaudal D n=1 Tax=Ischnura elegans TaxID=197161 RepID=UPI001ED89E8F|nr:protein bicaudal D [Ischnura elegans]
MASPGSYILEELGIDELRREVERLSRELDQASSENVQSAQYGLELLAEKGRLEVRCSELEALYENTKHELDITQEALAKFQTSHKVTTETGIEQEESLLNESAALKTSLNTKILELESDSKQMRQELERLIAERERFFLENNELNKDREEWELERRSLRAEIREAKKRETRLLLDNSELEEENIGLQKQVSSLRSSQVEFEGAKHEIRHLHEEIDVLNQQADEQMKLQRILERQLEEALESLQVEREAKYALKKELDQRINSESMFNLSNLAFSIRGITEEQSMGSGSEEEGEGYEGEEGMDVDEGEGEVDGSEGSLQRFEAALKRKKKKRVRGGATSTPAPGHHGKQVDLFSEIHLNEVRRLEKQLEQLEGEKSALTVSMREAQGDADKRAGQLELLRGCVALLAAHSSSLQHLKTKASDQLAECPSPSKRSKEDISKKNLDTAIINCQQWFVIAGRELDQLQQDIAAAQKQCSDGDNEENGQSALSLLQAEVTNIKNQLLEAEHKALGIEQSLGELAVFASEAGASLDAAMSDLTAASDELAQLYHHVCAVNGDTPSRVLLDHQKPSSPVQDGVESNQGAKGDQADVGKDVVSSSGIGDKLARLQGRLPSQVAPRELESLGEAAMMAKFAETLVDQMRHLRAAVEKTIDLSKAKGLRMSASVEAVNDSKEAESQEIQELQEQVVKLKALLSTKREQIATLRTVLKSNKNTAEVALNNLKSKYENEKAVVSDTMMKLRNELRHLKEDAATFSSLRAMFAARCEEYVTQVDEMQRQLAAAEEEKKTLNQLLRLAVKQKLSLTQKLEELEVCIEMRSSNARRHGGGHGGSSALSTSSASGQSGSRPTGGSSGSSNAKGLSSSLSSSPASHHIRLPRGHHQSGRDFF